jgi:hypothetical protein
MSIHLELEEFDRIRPAQRIPNTENRTLQAKVKQMKSIFLNKIIIQG